MIDPENLGIKKTIETIQRRMDELLKGAVTDVPAPVAYCAPGRIYMTMLALVQHGSEVSEIVEHPWMAGRTDVILVAAQQEWPSLELEF